MVRGREEKHTDLSDYGRKSVIEECRVALNGGNVKRQHSLQGLPVQLGVLVWWEVVGEGPP